MTDEELLTGFVRVRKTAQRIFFEVRMAAPQSAETFAQRWSLAAALPPSASALHVARVRLMVLADYRYFRVCDACEERFPRGWFTGVIGEEDVCYDCRARAIDDGFIGGPRNRSL